MIYLYIALVLAGLFVGLAWLFDWAFKVGQKLMARRIVAHLESQGVPHRIAVVTLKAMLGVGDYTIVSDELDKAKKE